MRQFLNLPISMLFQQQSSIKGQPYLEVSINESIKIFALEIPCGPTVQHQKY